MRFQAGDRCCFLGYSDLPKGADPIFFQGDIIAVAKVEPDDVLLCFPIDGWGRVFSWQGETVFTEEVIRLPFPRSRCTASRDHTVKATTKARVGSQKTFLRAQSGDNASTSRLPVTLRCDTLIPTERRKALFYNT